MSDGFLGYVFIALAVYFGVTQLVARDWRWNMGALALQYLVAFVFISGSWPLELAAVKLVAGWMAGSILGLTRMSLFADEPNLRDLDRTGVAFRIFAALLVLLVVLGAAPRLSAWAAPIGLNQAWAALVLMGMGLLQIGLAGAIFPAVLGLLTLLSGFEILYAAVEVSTLVAGLQALITLGIALVGAYLLNAPTMEALE